MFRIKKIYWKICIYIDIMHTMWLVILNYINYGVIGLADIQSEKMMKNFIYFIDKTANMELLDSSGTAIIDLHRAFKYVKEPIYLLIFPELLDVDRYRSIGGGLDSYSRDFAFSLKIRKEKHELFCAQPTDNSIKYVTLKSFSISQDGYMVFRFLSYDPADKEVNIIYDPCDRGRITITRMSDHPPLYRTLHLDDYTGMENVDRLLYEELGSLIKLIVQNHKKQFYGK